MKKILLIATILIFNNIYSQIDSTKVSFVAYWAKNDSYDFKITKIENQWKDTVRVKQDTNQYIVNFKVLDSTDVSYKIQWTYKNSLISNFEETIKQNYSDTSVVNNLFKKYDASKVIYSTNELGEFQEIHNWKELSQLMTELLSELEISLIKKNPENSDKIKKVIKPLSNIYSSKDGIEQLILSDLQFFHFPFGVEYDIINPIVYEQELPNLLGGDPLIGEATLTFEEVDFEEEYCVMKEEVIIRPEDTKRVVLEFFKKLGVENDKAEKLIKTSKIDIKDLNFYQYYYYPGVPHRIYGSRDVFIEIDNKVTKKLTELEIELIYED